jgi:hypothetical protein
MRVLVAVILSVLHGFPAFADSVESWEDLKRIIKEKKIANIDDLLTHLPPDYTKGYTLIYRTRALNQETVSPRRPRVVLFGQNARFVLAYNSHVTGGKARPGDREVIETLEFDRIKGQSLLREVAFNGEVPNLDAVTVNPDRCLACHAVTSDPPMKPKHTVRGLWDPYNSWAGVYGSLSRNDADFMKFDTQEYRNFQEFLKEKPNNPRYAHLPLGTKKLSQLGIEEYKPGLADDALTFSNGYSSNPNQMLGMHLADYNFRRVGNILAKVAPVETRKAFQYLVRGLTLDEKSFVRRDRADRSNPTYVNNKTYDCLNTIASFLPDSMPKVSFDDFATKFLIKARLDYVGRKALVERDNMGLSKFHPGFYPADPYDEGRDHAPRYLRFDSIDPVTYQFKQRNSDNPGYFGAVALFYLFYLMDLPSQDLNTAITHGDNVSIDANYVLSGSTSISYGNVARCYRNAIVKKTELGGPIECASGGADEFFLKYLPRSFYKNPNGTAFDPQIRQIKTCGELAVRSKEALTKYFEGR